MVPRPSTSKTRPVTGAVEFTFSGGSATLAIDVNDGTSLAGFDLSGLDFRGADFRRTDLSNCNLMNGDFSGANFAGIDMVGANLSNSKFDGANFEGADLRGSALNKGAFKGANFSNAKLPGANFSDANFENTVLDNANLSKVIGSYAVFNNAHIVGADFTDANLQDVRFGAANLQYSVLQRANLKYAILEDADLTHANLQGANMQYVKASRLHMHFARADGVRGQFGEYFSADITYTPMSDGIWDRANFTDAIVQDCYWARSSLDNTGFNRTKFNTGVFNDCVLRETRFYGCNLEGTTIRRADWYGAVLDANTIFANATLSDNYNLDEVVGLSSASWGGAHLDFDPDDPEDAGSSAVGWILSLFDGYVVHSVVFFDANRNGIQDANEPATTTDKLGVHHLALENFEGNFDANGDSILNPSEGRLAAKGGLDIAKGLPLGMALTAPGQAVVISPLTTLLDQLITRNPTLTLDQADAQVKAALGLSAETAGRIKVLRYDPFRVVDDTDADAGAVQAASAKIYDTVVQASALLDGASNASASEINNALWNAMAARIQASGQLNLSSGNSVAELIQTAATDVNTTIPANAAQAAASVIAEVNFIKDEVVASDLTASETLAAITQAQRVAQARIAPALAQVGAGQLSVDELAASYSGPALQQAVDTAPVGDLDGFDTSPGMISFERDSFRVREDGQSLEPVTLVRRTGT